MFWHVEIVRFIYIGLLLSFQNCLTHVFKGNNQFLFLYDLQKLDNSWIYVTFPRQPRSQSNFKKIDLKKNKNKK